MRARVFISCGQAPDLGERGIAREIARRLEDLGYEPYVAVEEQTLAGVRENIFARLERVEYFLFVDFKRERFAYAGDHRGSLFSHQELAIASFLDTPVLAFQETGVRALDGLMAFVQGNAIEFGGRENLPDEVESRVRRSTWQPDWRNELTLTRDAGEKDTADTGAGRLGTFYHINVRNLNPRTTARNCCAYLNAIRSHDSGQLEELRTVELKWAGYTQPAAHVRGGSSRPFDAFWVDHEYPEFLRFNLFSDSPLYNPKVKRPGVYSLQYTVTSDNFPTVSRWFRAELGEPSGETRLEEETAS